MHWQVNDKIVARRFDSFDGQAFYRISFVFPCGNKIHLSEYNSGHLKLCKTNEIILFNILFCNVTHLRVNRQSWAIVKNLNLHRSRTGSKFLWRTTLVPFKVSMNYQHFILSNISCHYKYSLYYLYLSI